MCDGGYVLKLYINIYIYAIRDGDGDDDGDDQVGSMRVSDCGKFRGFWSNLLEGGSGFLSIFLQGWCLISNSDFFLFFSFTCWILG